MLAFRLSEKQTAVENVCVTNGKAQAQRPTALRPMVSKQQWGEWEAVFEQFDRDRNELVSASDMVKSNVFSKMEADAIVQLFDTQETPRGSRHIPKAAFMKEILNVHGYRLVDPSGAPL